MMSYQLRWCGVVLRTGVGTRWNYSLKESNDGGIGRGLLYCSLPPEGDVVALATILASSPTGKHCIAPLDYNKSHLTDVTING